MKRTDSFVNKKLVMFMAGALMLFAKSVDAGQYRISDVGFAAPAINGSANVTSPELGAIIFDSGAGEFRGFDGTSWLTMGASSLTAPTVRDLSLESSPYTPTTGVLWIKVKMVGGGGGGSGSGTTGNLTNGVSGNPTTFGSSLLVANGGNGGVASNIAGGSGGTASGCDISIAGGNGGNGNNVVNSSNGGNGGVSAFGGTGQGGAPSFQGFPAAAGSGSGGGGGGGATSVVAAPGGGSGGYCEKIISNPSGSYPFSIGSGGNGGVAGTSGYAGGNGAGGFIVVEEYYQ